MVWGLYATKPTLQKNQKPLLILGQLSTNEFLFGNLTERWKIQSLQMYFQIVHDCKGVVGCLRLLYILRSRPSNIAQVGENLHFCYLKLLLTFKTHPTAAINDLDQDDQEPDQAWEKFCFQLHLTAIVQPKIMKFECRCVSSFRCIQHTGLGGSVMMILLPENLNSPSLSLNTLPETNIFAPKNGWLEYDPFLLGLGLFSGANC